MIAIASLRMSDTFTCRHCGAVSAECRHLPGYGDLCSFACYDAATSWPGPPKVWTVEEMHRCRITYAAAERMHRDGTIPQETWEAYCYLFRDAAFKYSDLGKWEAAAHARRNGLPAPYSDRPVADE